MSKNTNLSFLTDYITADITNGRIGINTPSPTVAFDVTGVAKFSSSVTAADLIISDTYANDPLIKLATTTSGSVEVQMRTATTTYNAGIGVVTSGYDFGLFTNNTTRMTITSAGNVLIGTTTFYNGNFTAAASGLNINGSAPISLLRETTNGNLFYMALASTQAFLATPNAIPLTFGTSDVERMRITSGGNVLIGGTSTLGAGGTNLEISGGRAQLVVNSTTATASWFSVYPAGDGNTYILRNTGYSYLFGTATNQATAGFVQQMSISSNGSIGAPSGTNIYNASDVRLKKNISTTTYGLDTISALNPVKFNWVDGFEPSEDGKDMLGFVAQEVQQVIPEAVEGFGGNSITIADTIIDNPLRVNEKFIIPVLVKAIQELKAEIETLKNK